MTDDESYGAGFAAGWRKARDAMMEGLPPVQAFGKWDAPITDDAVWLDAPPADLRCMHCLEGFRPDDNGAVLPTGMAQHRECALRSVSGGIGHAVNHDRYCVRERDPDAGLTYRQSAWLLWRHAVERIPVTETELDVLAKIEARGRRERFGDIANGRD